VCVCVCVTLGSRVETLYFGAFCKLSVCFQHSQVHISSSALKSRISPIYGPSQRSQTVRCSKPAEGQIFRHPSRKDPRPVICPVKQYRCPLPEKTRPGVNIEYPTPFSAEVKKEWSYASTPPVCHT